MSTLLPPPRAMARILVATLAAIGLLSTLTAPAKAVQVESYTVCPSGCRYRSIQAAVDATGSGGTVTVGPGTYTETILFQSDVRVVGAGEGSTIVQGDGAHAVITFWGAAVGRNAVIEALSVTGGGGAYGAGILVQRDATPTIRSVSVYNNAAAESGGGIALLERGDALLEDLQVRDNRAQSAPGLFITNGRATVRNSTFANNRASGQPSSGALYVTGGSELVMENSVVSGSSASLGGGLRVTVGSSVTITGGSFQNNSATSTGGAISSNTNATLTLSGVAFSGNQANLGGALSLEGTTTIITNCSFENNRAASSGGAIRGASGGSIVVADSRFAGNVATSIHGGAIHLIETAGEVRHSTFENNQAHSGGGAVSLANMTNNTLLIGNTATNNRAGSGSGFYVERGRARIIDNVIRDNDAEDFGGGIVVIGMTDVLLRHNDVSHNVAGIDGGGVVMQRGTSGVVEDNIISFNRSEELAAGLKIYDRTSPTIRNNRFEGNAVNRSGGAIYIEDNSNPLVQNNEFSGNTAVRYGGAVAINPDSTPVLRYNSFSKNRATVGGGAIFVHLGSRARVEHNTFTLNWAGSTGGAIFALDDEGSIISENYFSRNQSDDRGGAVFGNGSSLELNGNHFVGNTARGFGGGVAVVNEGTPQIVNNLIAGNQADGEGDGIYVRAAAVLQNNTIADNDRNRDGDGIFLSDTTEARLSNNLVVGNGYGIRSLSPQPRQMSRNCFFGNQRANYQGVQAGPDDFSNDPLLVKGIYGSYYLSHSTAGQPDTSPLVDAASQSAQALGLDQETTRTDGRPDQGRADVGFHFPRQQSRRHFLPMMALSW